VRVRATISIIIALLIVAALVGVVWLV
jgi:hypothetical protein